MKKTLRGLLGISPAPFEYGRRIEVWLRSGRLVRGVVLEAGGGMAQLEIGGNASRIALISYEDVARWRKADPAAPSGNWNQPHPDHAAQLEASTNEWTQFSQS